MQKSLRALKKPQTLVLLALLIALQVVMTRFLSIMPAPWLRISLGFLPIAAAGMLFGPIAAALAGALGDVVGFFLFPSGTFFPGYTLTTAMSGFFYGLFLFGIYKEIRHASKTVWLRILLCELTVTVVCYLLLNTLWAHITGGKAILVLLPTRAVKNIAQYPINVLLLMEIGILLKRLPSSLRPSLV